MAHKILIVSVLACPGSAFTVIKLYQWLWKKVHEAQLKYFQSKETYFISSVIIKLWIPSLLSTP